MTSAPSRFRDPGSLQVAPGSRMTYFLEVIILGRLCVEVRTEPAEVRLAHVASAVVHSRPLWEG